MPRSSPTPAPSQARRAHFVVDGSNIATEGRSQPSLQQLNEAVLAFMEDHPGVVITVVVDATFGHRIDKKEVKEFDLAVANNELVTPPAGAVGRGDAFVLSIANKAKAGILSNDSFQEFHGLYDWLFEPGRLIGGKPVPHVGWVFVERTPVRGPKSRQSVKEAKIVADGGTPPSGRRRRGGGTSSGSPLANEPLPMPTAPPPGPAKAVAHTAAPIAEAEVKQQAVAAAATAPAAGKGAPVNELMPFLDFVEQHPLGTSCTAVIESYSSHGAYGRAGTVLVYIPLRLMDDPPPRSARSRLKLGEAVTLVVVGYAPERRSVDAALPHMTPAGTTPPADAPAAKPAKATRSRRGAKAPVETVETVEATEVAPVETTDAPGDATPEAAKPQRGRRGRKPAAADSAVDVAPAAPAADDQPERTTTAGRRSRRPKAAVEAAPAPVEAPAPAPEPAKPRRSTKKAAAPAPAAELAAPAAPVKKAAKATTATKASPAKKAPAKKAAAKTAPAKKAAAKKAAAKKAPAEAS